MSGTHMNAVLMWPAIMRVVKTPTRKKTVTGTTTASHQGVVGTANEAVTGIETEGTDEVLHATGPPRYGNLHLLVFITRLNESLSLVFSQC